MVALGNLRSAKTITPSAYCQARQRLTLDTLQVMAGQVAWSTERHVLKHKRWLAGREVKIIDGTCISRPDTPANQAAWPQRWGKSRAAVPGVEKIGRDFVLWPAARCWITSPTTITAMTARSFASSGPS